MKDQHTKIKGYRDLSQDEIDLMNKIKAHGEETKSLIQQLETIQPTRDVDSVEAYRCLNIAKDYLQTGQMWFVRAVALPESF